MDAWVNVNGRTRLARGPGIRRKKIHWSHQVIRGGRMRRGARHTSAINEDKHIVPREVKKACDAAARTIALDGVFGGIEWR